MSDGLKEKFGIFKGLVELIDRNFRATVTTILVLGGGYLIWDRDKQKDKLYGMVIEEVRKQVPKAVSDSLVVVKQNSEDNKRILQESSRKVDTILDKTSSTLDNLNKKANKKR